MNPIKALRKEKRLTQTQLASEIGVDQATVSKWEIGRANPEPQYANRLAEFFDVPAEYILGDLEDERSRKIDHWQGLVKILDEAATGAKETGIISEVFYQTASTAIPQPYYGLLQRYRQEDAFKELMVLWERLTRDQKNQVIGFMKGMSFTASTGEENDHA